MVVKTYPGAPSLAYIVARRVCDKNRVASALIFVQGGMGIGKSTFSLHLAEEVARWIGIFTRKSPQEFFSMDNVRTVSREGGLEILTSDALLKEHSILLIDDARISADSAKFQTKANSVIRDIATIMRPFRGVLIVNSVSFKHIDKGLRELCTYLITVIGSNTTTGQSFAKVYKYSVNEFGESRKFLTWTDKAGQKHRMVVFIGGQPSKKLGAEYKKTRMGNSVELVMEARKQMQEGSLSVGGGKSRGDGRSAASDALAQEKKGDILKLYDEGLKPTTIARKLNLTPRVVSKALVGVGEEK